MVVIIRLLPLVVKEQNNIRRLDNNVNHLDCIVHFIWTLKCLGLVIFPSFVLLF